MARKSKAKDIRLILPGVDLTARFKDGRSELVRVTEVDIDSMRALLAGMRDVCRRVELYCEKPAGWAKTLTTSSLTEILTKGKEINDPLFDAWYRDHRDAMEILNPGWKKQADAIVEEVLRDAVSKAVSSASSSNVSPSPTGQD